MRPGQIKRLAIVLGIPTIVFISILLTPVLIPFHHDFWDGGDPNTSMKDRYSLYRVAGVFIILGGAFLTWGIGLFIVHLIKWVKRG